MSKVKDSPVLSADVRSRGFTCLGPTYLPKEAIQNILDAFYKAFDANDFAAIKLVKEALDPSKQFDVPEDNWNVMYQAISTLASSRKGCGYDIGSIILEGEADGEQHSYVCPGCGLDEVYFAPKE